MDVRVGCAVGARFRSFLPDGLASGSRTHQTQGKPIGTKDQETITEGRVKILGCLLIIEGYGM